MTFLFARRETVSCSKTKTAISLHLWCLTHSLESQKFLLVGDWGLLEHLGCHLEHPAFHLAADGRAPWKEKGLEMLLRRIPDTNQFFTATQRTVEFLHSFSLSFLAVLLEFDRAQFVVAFVGEPVAIPEALPMTHTSFAIIWPNMSFV